MWAGRDNPTIPDLFRSVRMPNLGDPNLAGTAAAGDSNPIASPALFSTSTLDAMHEIGAPPVSPSSSISCAAEQQAGPSIVPSWNFPAGCTQVPISIIVFHRRLTGRGSRSQLPPSSRSMPAPALPSVSEDGASIQLTGSNFLSLGRASSDVVGHMEMDPSQLATPGTYNLEHAPIHLRPNLLDDEASKTGSETETSQVQQSARTIYCDSHATLESVVTANTLGKQVHNSQGSTALLAEGSTDENMNMYQPMQKRPKIQINQTEHTPFSPPSMLNERTLTQIEMQIAGAEKTETFRNGDTPGQKPKTRRKKHRPKVIREDKKAKVQNPVDSTPDGKSPYQKVKRSYVRKKRNLSPLEKCSGPVSNQSISGGTEIAARRTASVRRSLQFGLEEQGVQEDQSLTANSNHLNYEKFAHAQNSFCSVTESEVQIGHGLQVDMDNSPAGLAFGLSLKLNKLLDEYIHLPEVTPQPTQEVSNATSGSFGRELAREQDNVRRTYNPGASSEYGSSIDKTVGMTAIEENKTELEFNYSNTDDFLCSVRSLSEMESTRSQMSKASKVENHTHCKNGESSRTGARDCIILRTAAEMLAVCQGGGIKKNRSARVCRNSFVPSMDLEDNALQASTRMPQPCMDALYESSYIKFMTKKRSQKARSQAPSSIQPNVELNNRLSAGTNFYGGSDGSKISEETSPKSSLRTLDNKGTNVEIHCKIPEGSLTNTSAVPYMDYLQGVASKLKRLDLNTEQLYRAEMQFSPTPPSVISFGGTDGLSNALVPYGDAVVIPYERPLQLAKKQRPRAKVDLDFETTRVWNLLMGIEAEPVDGTDVEKERWWQQEREVFEGRANSFIARMRLVQGDRRFSPWKGSVVDSVVGVFLTQNVADHLSSSAYMALAATFPSRPVSSNCKDDATTQDNEQNISADALGVSSNCKDDATTQDNEQNISADALGEKCMFDLFYNGATPDLGVSCEEISMTCEKIYVEPKHITSANELMKGEDYSLDYKSANAGFCNCQGTGIEHKAQQSPDCSSVDLTASTEVQQQMQFQNEVSSSQSVTSETLQSRLSSSSRIPRNFVVGGSAAASQQVGSNVNHVKLLRENGTGTSEIECQRLNIAAINGDGSGKPGTPNSPTMLFSYTVDPQQLDLRNEPGFSSISSNSSSGSAPPCLKNSTIEKANPLFVRCDSHTAERCGNRSAGITPNSLETSTDLAVKLQHDKRTSFEGSDLQEHGSLFVTGEMIAATTREKDECTLTSGFTSYNGVPDKAAQTSKKKGTTSKKNAENFDWDKLRRQVSSEGQMKERSSERRDFVDWEAVRCADVQRISHAIRERGMNNILAERIQNFLNRLVKDHGSIDLEWLRDIPTDSAKDYLLSIRGLGLKSVECVRLLTLHHLAFPVDTNVGRICVRLGWVPIQPLPESLQLHLLELYPVLETIQKYLWPRLCKLDQQTLYELHYQMITFGKVFCTKSKPNCNACPMRSECKHFASAFASARLALPAPQEKSLVESSNQFAFQNSSTHPLNSTHLPRLGIHAFLPKKSEPIIEEPASPREECPETVENDIEDFVEDGEIPTIKLNMEAFAQNLENCIKESNKELQSDDIAKALVAISNEAASIPLPKLKNVHRLRTEHYVYELPDSHPLLQQLGLDQREPDDPSPYLLVIWTPGEIKETSKAPKPCCASQMEGGLCSNEMCHNCIAERQNQSRYVRGTILIPCRTAMRGSFPLNGTYFQVNEVFADHQSSHNPIHVERKHLWNLHRRMVFFGTSVPTIFKGLTTEEIQQCFWRGFVCVRGFDLEFRAPRPLCPHLHVVARPRTRKTSN